MIGSLSCFKGVAAGDAAGRSLSVTDLNLAGGAHIVRSVMNAVFNVAGYAQFGFTFTI